VPLHRLPQHRQGRPRCRRGDPLVIPAELDYVCAESLEQTATLLAENEDAKLLAGGQSLLPLMKLRFARPSILVDAGRIPGLSYVREDDGHVAIGALTTHHEVATSSLLQHHCRVLADAAATVGDPQVRHLGTIGGATAHADPAGGLPTVLLALQAALVITGRGDVVRAAHVEGFFQGLFQPDLAPGEVITEVRVPNLDGGSAYIRFARRALDWATVSVAAVKHANNVVVALGNMSDRPLRAAQVERALEEGASHAEAALLADEGADPPSDEKAGAEFRRELSRVLTRRALEQVL